MRVEAAWNAGIDQSMTVLSKLDLVEGESGYSENYEAKGAKVKVMQDLAADTGLPEPVVAELIRQWAHTSNDDDYRALWLQKMAAEEFGVPLSDWQAEKLVAFESVINPQREEFERAQADPITRREGAQFLMPAKYQNPLENMDFKSGDLAAQEEAGRTFLRAMYDRTQSFLSEHGVEEVVLYRGQQYLREQSPEFGEHVPAVENAVESWSTSRDTARSFGSDWNERISGVVERTVVPAARILATPFTGVGCLGEGEVVVLGGLGESEVVDKDGKSSG